MCFSCNASQVILGGGLIGVGAVAIVLIAGLLLAMVVTGVPVGYAVWRVLQDHLFPGGGGTQLRLPGRRYSLTSS